MRKCQVKQFNLTKNYRINFFSYKNLSKSNNTKRSQACMPNIINLIKLTAKKIKFYFLNNFNVKNKNN